MAVNVRLVAIGAVLGCAAVGIGVLIYQSVEENNERLRGKEQAKVEAANQLAANIEALKELGSGTVARWDLAQQRRYEPTAVQAVNAKDCPEYFALKEKPDGDEFDRRERPAKLEELAQACRSRAPPPPAPPRLPSIAVIDVPFASVGDFDFGRKHIPLVFPEFQKLCPKPSMETAFMTCRWEGDQQMVRVPGAGDLLFATFRYANLLVVSGAFAGLEMGGSAYLKVDEGAAKDLKRRLARSHPRLLVAFRPGTFGQTSYSTEDQFGKRTPISGMSATAVGYKIADDVGDVVPWTAFGRNAAGETVKPVISPSKPTRAQQLRLEMPEADLKELKADLGKMRSKRRWPEAQQIQYRDICLKQKAQEPSTNLWTCDCFLEVMMDKYKSLGAYTQDLVDTGAKPDEKTAGLFGACLAAFGD